MSIPTKDQAARFLAPLRGNSTILMLHDPQARTKLGRFLLQCARLQSAETAVLDSDAFYCANITAFAEEAKSIAKAELLLLPERGFEVASLLPLLSSKREMLIIDDLNSLYSLASDGRRSHQLAIFMRLLSYNARMNRSWVLSTAYKTNLGNRQATANQRSLTSLGDLLIDTELQGASVKLKASFNSQWPNDELIV